MFTEQDLRELLDFKTEHPVLSVYLNTDPSQGSADGYKPRLRSMLKDIGLKNDVQKVQQYINFEFDWSGRGVAMFSCAEEDFFRVFSMAQSSQESGAFELLFRSITISLIGRLLSPLRF